MQDVVTPMDVPDGEHMLLQNLQIGASIQGRGRKEPIRRYFRRKHPIPLHTLRVFHRITVDLESELDDPGDLLTRLQADSNCCANCVEHPPPPAPEMGARFTVFGACRSCGLARWLALLLTKAGDVETNPGPTTLNKKVWICDICHKQIHARKQISIGCNRIEHWVHLRCAGICQAQYTDTWTCHLHRESRLTPYTDITPPHRSRPWSNPLHTPHLHHLHNRNQNTDICPTLPLSLHDW